MALIFCDGFDHYKTADILKKWDVMSYYTNINSNGRNGQCLYFNSSDRFISKNLLSTYSTLCVGFAYKSNALSVGNNKPLLRLYEDGKLHIDIRQQNNTGKLYVTRNGTVLGTTLEQVVFAGAWVHIQLKVYIHDSAGTVDLLINNVNVLSLSDVDTNNDGTGINIIQLYSVIENCYFDDFWIDDANLLGDCKVETLYPSGAGTTTQWDALSGNNYENVDEALQDDDTSYVSTLTPNEIDTYTFGNLVTTSGTVYGVQVNMVARKDDAGSRSIAPVVRPSNTDRIGNSVLVLDSYMNYTQTYATNPDNNEAWTIADVNGAEFGIKLIE